MGGNNTGIKLGIVRGISYGVFGPAGTFMPQTRALGASPERAETRSPAQQPARGIATTTAAVRTL